MTNARLNIFDIVETSYYRHMPVGGVLSETILDANIERPKTFG